MDYVKPLEVNAVLREDNNGIDITWAEMKSVEGFRIYRSANGQTPELLIEKAVEDCELYWKTMKDNPEFFHTDRKAKEGVTYEYYVEAYTGEKVHVREKAPEAVEYRRSDYYIKVGETSSELAQDIEDARQLLIEMGMEVDYTVTLKSNFPQKVQVDENNNIIGVSPGKAVITKTVTMIIDGEESITKQELEVSVLLDT